MYEIKDNDEVVSAFVDKGNTLFVTKNGYYLKFNSEEISIVSPKASGVKGIKLKEDIVVKGLSLDNNTEYLTVITDKHTAKRVKITELETLSRALKGSTLVKKVKSKPYYITNIIPVDSKNILGLKIDGDIKGIKSVDIPIMDLSSTGSVITKQNLEDVFKVVELIECKLDEKNKNEEPSIENAKELTIDDFIDDFKL